MMIKFDHTSTSHVASFTSSRVLYPYHLLLTMPKRARGISLDSFSDDYILHSPPPILPQPERQNKHKSKQTLAEISSEQDHRWSEAGL